MKKNCNRCLALHCREQRHFCSLGFKTEIEYRDKYGCVWIKPAEECSKPNNRKDYAYFLEAHLKI